MSNCLRKKRRPPPKKKKKREREVFLDVMTICSVDVNPCKAIRIDIIRLYPYVISNQQRKHHFADIVSQDLKKKVRQLV